MTISSAVAPRTTTIELFKEAMKFSAGHFTIFSATDRENLHGHNFTVYAAITSSVPADGMLFDYAVYKKQLLKLCRAWNEILLLPTRSPHLIITTTETQVTARFRDEVMSFPKRDVLLLPVSNVTVEELSRVLLDELVEFRSRSGHEEVSGLVVKVFSGPGQCASAEWCRA